MRLFIMKNGMVLKLILVMLAILFAYFNSILLTSSSSSFGGSQQQANEEQQHHSLGDFHHLFQYSSKKNDDKNEHEEGGATLTEKKVDGSNTHKTISSNNNSNDDNKITIFYHVFVPPTKPRKYRKGKNASLYKQTSANNALRIVKEQLLQVKTSYLVQSGKFTTDSTKQRKQQITLYYITIGNNGILTPELMSTSDYCGGTALNCIHLAHYDSGYEEKTLQHLHSHCSTSNIDKTNERVLYIHSKGAFHNWKADTNERWRRHMTAAITSEQCLAPSHANKCDACGLAFMSIPVVIYSGNMWVANCNYIRKLLPLDLYERRVNETVTAMSQLVNETKLTKLLYHNNTRKHHQVRRPFMYGQDRYLAENWIGSYPNFHPCDVSNIINGTAYWRNHNYNNNDEYVWSNAPRYPLMQIYNQIYPEMNATVILSKQLRSREYFLLPGLLYKYYLQYNGMLPSTTTTSSSTSWVYDHYPDGQLWRQRITKYGPKEAIKKFILT